MALHIVVCIFFSIHLLAIYSNAGQKSAEGRFLSKLVYKFRPAKNLCTYQDIHIWGGQYCGQQQKYGAKCSKPQGNFFCRLAVLFLPALPAFIGFFFVFLNNATVIYQDEKASSFFDFQFLSTHFSCFFGKQTKVWISEKVISL